MKLRIFPFLALALAASAAFVACSSGESSLVPDAGHDAKAEASPPDAPSLDGFSVPTGCNPLAITSECMLPYPSDFLTKPDPTTPTGLRMNLPPHALTIPKGSTPIDLTPFNRGDGAPTSAPVLVHFGVNVDASFLADNTQTAKSVLASSAIAIFDEATGERVPFLSEMDANDPTMTTRHTLIVRPLTPLELGSKYIVVLTSALRDTSGHALPASKGFEALRDKIPTHVAPIEAARSRFETIFSFLESHGYPRSELLLAWGYTTASNHTVIGPITKMRDVVFDAGTGHGPSPDGGTPDGGVAEGGPAEGGAMDAGGAGEILYTITSVSPSPYTTGANVVEGTFSPPNFLQADNTILYTSDNVPVEQTGIPRPSYPFTMIVPSKAKTQSLSLLVFGHGLFGSGRDYLTTSFGSTIQPLSEQFGAAVVATDWIGLSSGDLNLIIKDVVPNLNRIGIVTDRLLQALVNNLSLIELCLGALGEDPQVRLSTAHPFVNPSEVFYYGVSLGGIEGSSLISVARNITRGAVAVPGASWNNLLARSYDYAQIKIAISGLYPDPLLQQEFITLLQSRFDPADPVNLATLFQKHPLPNSPKSRVAVIQESIDDCQVPNIATEILARTYGAVQITPDIVPIYGLKTTSGASFKTALSQYELKGDVAKYVPPTSNLLPTMDNGAHFDLAFRPQVLGQVTELMTTGAIVQSCDGGPCYLP
jgi:hypothetical protein